MSNKIEKLIERLKQSICNHHWARTCERDVIHGVIHEWRICIKCGREDGK